MKTFLKDNVDVLGLAQALMEQINEKIQANPGVSLEDLGIAIPFSDENLMGKLHPMLLFILMDSLNVNMQVLLMSWFLPMIFLCCLKMKQEENIIV